MQISELIFLWQKNNFSFSKIPFHRKRQKLHNGSYTAPHLDATVHEKSTLPPTVPTTQQSTAVEDFVSSVMSSCKLDVLFSIILNSRVHGDKLVVFSSSLTTLDFIENLLETLSLINSHVATSNRINNGTERGAFPITSEPTHWSSSLSRLGSWKKKEDFLRIDGSTPKEKRQEVVNEFNNPSSPSKLLLVSTTAGGIGTNLVGANRAVLMDVSWNPTTDQQAIFRLYRLGQKKEVRSFFFLNYETLRYSIIIFPDPFDTDGILERILFTKLNHNPIII